MRDKSAKHVSQSRKVHKPVEVLDTLAHIAEASQDAAMVNKQKMIVDRFLPGTQPTAQPQGGDHTPLPQASAVQKRNSALATNLPKFLVMLLQRLLLEAG